MKGVWGRKIPPAKGMRLSDRVFFCPGCGWATDRDHNAPLDILRRSGWEPLLEPMELRPLPAVSGQGGAMKREAPSAIVDHNRVAPVKGCNP